MSDKIEVLAPVGSWETLMAAIQGGADAVYFGIGSLNMRSRSTINFTTDDIQKLVRICKDNHVKTYVTLNTVVYDSDIEELSKLIPIIANSGIDAVVANDIAVIKMCREHNISVHGSTQLNISNIEAVRFFAQYCDTIVLARELSLKQIHNITQTIKKENIKGPSGNLLQIEVFVHGALCMAISGKCYLSLHAFNASANRGACYQVCRRRFTVVDKEAEVELEIDNDFILSPKDLCTIGFLDKILRAGATILKIEGRARSPEYVKTVTKCYKEAVQAIQNGTYSQEKINNWLNELSKVFNRGFWEGHYLGQKIMEITNKPGSQAQKTKTYVGKVTNYFNKIGVAEITLETGEINLNDEILIIGNTTGVVELNVEEIRVNYENTSKATKGEVCSIPCKELVRRGDKVYKLIDNEF